MVNNNPSTCSQLRLVSTDQRVRLKTTCVERRWTRKEIRDV